MIKMYTDASTKNNPGPSGVGIVISNENRYNQLSFPLEGNLSNHEAEFEALLKGLTYLIEHQLNHETLMMYTDSKLLASAIKKNYVKKDIFKSYLLLIQEKLSYFPLFFIQWIPESHNKGADHLAKQALQKVISKK
ncbi:ribonuclease HI family protein [Carnobacterium pleistocenium]|uniref:ribonuclease HI family protein n=1 Tax=Carnobacterium pleistocenium TaxID=181073 RepID=UPI000554CDD1|nr:ribonuclease HI family protein [Carnobacterium pleistocenium]